jgi:putative nucleotidyltransferase with HDIG domain
MTVDKSAAERLIEKYALPDWLKRHSAVVRDVAWELAEALAAHGERVDVDGVITAAWLHDIGKSPLVADDERDHGELSALILAVEGLPELSEMARRHIVFAIRDPQRAPRTLEEKIVHYADRRGGMAVLSVEERLREQAERFPESAKEIWACRDAVKTLERELFAKLPFGPEALRGARPGRTGVI